MNYTFTEQIKPNKAFCTSKNIQVGSATRHFFAAFTSMKLLQNIQLFENPMYHIDATYKITVNRFPLIEFGLSDFNGLFLLLMD